MVGPSGDLRLSAGEHWAVGHAILAPVHASGCTFLEPMQRLGHSLPHLLLISLLMPCFAQVNPSSQTIQPNFDAIAAEAKVAREAGKNDEAIAEYRRALAIHSDWEEGWWYLGTLQYDRNHFAEAIPAFKKLVQVDSSLGPAWNFLGLCEFEIRDYENSLKHLEKGQALGAGDDPEISRVAKYHLALLLNRAGEFEKAASLLAASFLDRPSEQIRIALGLSLLRIPLTPQEIDPSRDALVHEAGEAATLLAQGDNTNAFRSFQSALSSYPDAPYLHYAFGVALASVGRTEDALTQQREEARLSPQSALPQLAISLLELRLKHSSEALRAAQTAVRLAPDSAAAQRALAQTQEALGKTKEAAESLRRAETVASGKPQRDSRIIQLYAQKNPASAPAAARIANPSESNSASFEALSHQAIALQRSGATSQSIRSYEEALQERPEWDEGRWNLAMLYYQNRRYSESISMLKTCVERNPDNGTAWAVMGLSEFEIKDYSNALIHLQRGYALGFGGSPESVQLAKYRLAVLLNRNAQFERAMEILASESDSKALGQEIRFTLGMALLRIPRAEQMPQSQHDLIENAGQIAALLQISKYDQALPRLENLIKRYPDVPFLRYAYGVGLSSLSQYAEAESQFRQEIAVSPKSELPYIRLASLSLQQRQPTDALPSALRAVQLAPNSGEAHYVLGRAYLELGQEESALHELQGAEKITPDSPEVHFNLAKAYAKVNLPEKERQERAIFTQLNETAQQQRAKRGSQSYGAAQDPSSFSVSSAQSTSATADPR
jgi:tetratricopeptide (TPR) repeat protein